MTQATITVFDPIYVQLQEEILKDPECQKYLMENGQLNDELPEKLAHVASYLNILVDGMYDPIDLATMLVEQMQRKNSIIIRI